MKKQEEFKIPQEIRTNIDETAIITKKELAKKILNEGIDEIVFSLSPLDALDIIRGLAERLDLLINLDNNWNIDERDVFDYNESLNFIIAETVYPDILEKGGHCDE